MDKDALEQAVRDITDTQTILGSFDTDALIATVKSVYDDGWNAGYDIGYGRGFVDKEKDQPEQQEEVKPGVISWLARSVYTVYWSPDKQAYDVAGKLAKVDEYIPGQYRLTPVEHPPKGYFGWFGEGCEVACVGGPLGGQKRVLVLTRAEREDVFYALSS